MKMLITGGAGFIGCNFVRHMLKEHPDQGDSRPGQAHVRRQAREPGGGQGPDQVRQGRHMRPQGRPRGRARVRRGRQLRRREPCRQEHHIPRGLREDRRARRVHAPRGGPQERCQAVRPDIHGRGVRLQGLGLVLTRRTSSTRPRRTPRARRAGSCSRGPMSAPTGST